MADNKFKQTKAGGVIANSEGVTNDGFKGGVFIGQRHSEGGIQVTVSGGGRAEIESEEPILVPESLSKTDKKTFDGKLMTNKEIASTINQAYGGVEIKKKGGVLQNGGQVKDNYQDIKSVADFNKRIVHTKDLRMFKIDYDNNISDINERIAHRYLQELALKYGFGVNEIDFKNYSKKPQNHFQLHMYTYDPKKDRDVILATNPFIYVDDKHKVVSDRTKVELLNEDYETIVKDLHFGKDGYVEVKPIPLLKTGGKLPLEKLELPESVKNGEIVVPASAVIITRGAALDTETKHEFNGKQLTNIEILSLINQEGGGAAFHDVIPAKIQVSEKVYEFDGESANDSAIAHKLGINSVMKSGGQLFLFKGKEYDVVKAYDLIKNKKIKFKIEKEETFPSKYSNYDKKFKDTADYSFPQGLMIKHDSGKCLLIDGNHRMDKAYNKGLKTVKVYYVSDPEAIAKFSRDIEFELGGNLHDDDSFASCGCQHEKEEFKAGGNVSDWDVEFTGGNNKGKKLSELEIDTIDVYDDYIYSLSFTDDTIFQAKTSETIGLLSITNNVVKLAVILDGRDARSDQKVIRRLQKLADDSDRIIVENNNISRIERRSFPYLLVPKEDAKNYVVAEKFQGKLDTPKKVVIKNIVQDAINSGSFVEQIKKGRDVKDIIDTIKKNGLEVPSEIIALSKNKMVSGGVLSVSDKQLILSRKYGKRQSTPVRIINTNDLTQDDYREFGNAAQVIEGAIIMYHLSDSDKLVNELEEGNLISETYDTSDVKKEELGAGVYGSAIPEYWVARSTDKYEFIKTLSVEKRKELCNKLKDTLNDYALGGYITQSEYQYAITGIREFEKTGSISQILTVAGQPYNIRFWENDYLKSIGVENTLLPKVIALKAKGVFVEFSDAPYLTKKDTDILISLGVDGAFVAGGIISNPEMVIFNTEAIEGYRVDKFKEVNFDSKYFNPVGKKKIFELGGQVLLAPNGKPSNLTPEQYRLVRTPEFIAWFGDFINDPENASKVVDSNGEPRIVYHGTTKIFNVFDSRKGSPSNGFYFSSTKEFAKKFAGNFGIVKECFLKIIDPVRNGFDRAGIGAEMSFDYKDGGIFIKRQTDKYAKKGTIEFIVGRPNQIKLADGSNIEFDPSNPDVRYKSGGELSSDQEATYKKWKHLVNMSVPELKKFYDSEEGKKAGLSVEEAHKLHIHNGRESARWIMKMIPINHKEWTPKMWEWANRQISFISRMKGNPGALYDKDGNKTRKHTSLLIWGHNPEKYGGGGVLDDLVEDEYPNQLFYQDYVKWYTKSISDKISIAISFPNEVNGYMFANKDSDIILDVFAKKYTNVDAKIYMDRITDIADKYGVNIWLEPKPLAGNNNVKPLSKADLIKYYEWFGFQLLNDGKMFRQFSYSFEGGGIVSGVYKHSKFGVVKVVEPENDLGIISVIDKFGEKHRLISKYANLEQLNKDDYVLLNNTKEIKSTHKKVSNNNDIFKHDIFYEYLRKAQDYSDKAKFYSDREYVKDLYSKKEDYVIKAIKRAKVIGVPIFTDTDEGVVYFETSKGQVSFHYYLGYYSKWIEDNTENVEGYKWSGKNDSSQIIDSFFLEVNKNMMSEGGITGNPEILKTIPYQLSNPKKNTLVYVSPEKLLKRAAIDNPSFDITNKENQIGSRLEKAKQFLINYVNDTRYINPVNKERKSYHVTFEPSIVYLYNDKIGFEDGRHRVLAAKELGLSVVGIEVPKSQKKYFEDNF